MIILDTNVISEVIRPRPDPNVISWVDSQDIASLYLTATSEAELRVGIALLPLGRRRDALATNIETILSRDFINKILSFDTLAAGAYAAIVASRQKQGLPILQFDAQIAAIARSRKAILATRNTADFVHCDISLINPWKFGSSPVRIK